MVNRAVFFRKAVSLKELKQDTEHYKDETSPFFICKRVELEDKDFNDFCDSLLKDRDFIAENKSVMGFDKAYYCILVYNKNSEDAILVESEGYNYARYTALVKKSEVQNG